MKFLTWQNLEQLIVAQDVINNVKLKSCGIKVLLSLIPLYWFILAQGAKRCHDLGNSGLYQLIPFYGFLMVLEDGDEGENEYGFDPKGRNIFSK